MSVSGGTPSVFEFTIPISGRGVYGQSYDVDGLLILLPQTAALTV
ncbi:hypothetical protein PROFUN_10831 [Planoprotostelium fungivorum]|uniref:Uncharacterized protein n=1 Tax=Planoprotostelium fungivorum TaxID=1890364 RepID=A0A2P6NCQ8_9EUKA|nr:hypothetical protein PROFUN_10831 [Planoprotostelium fungivorum]